MGMTKHGLSRTPEYKAWQQMRLRCTDPKHAAWAGYGGRGIDVCPQWLESVERFVADMGPRGEVHLTLGAVPASTMVRAVRAVMARADTSASSRIGARPAGPWPTRDDPLGQRGV